MRGRSMSKILLAAWLCCVAIGAAAQDCRREVRDGWIRLVPGGMPMHAGFGRIDNGCKASVTIVAASSPAYNRVELHRSTLENGVSRMRAVPELHIAAGKAAVLQPGGLHLMLVRPGSELAPGDRVKVSFELADGSRLDGEFEVREPAQAAVR
jgi:copper(I)-binding protein